MNGAKTPAKTITPIHARPIFARAGRIVSARAWRSRLRDGRGPRSGARPAASCGSRAAPAGTVPESSGGMVTASLVIAHPRVGDHVTNVRDQVTDETDQPDD